MLMYLGQNIRYLRKLKKITQTELGELLSKTHTVVGGYENGKTLPPLDVILEMCKIFEVDLTDFVLTNMAAVDYQPPELKKQAPNYELLNELLLKRVRQLEQEFKAMDPERAKRLGID